MEVKNTGERHRLFFQLEKSIKEASKLIHLDKTAATSGSAQGETHETK